MTEQEIAKILDETDAMFRRAFAACRLVPEWTSEERAAHDAKRAEAEKTIAEFRRKHPKLAAREDRMFARMDREIRQKVFGSHAVEEKAHVD
jgi:hypothetical protein